MMPIRCHYFRFGAHNKTRKLEFEGTMREDDPRMVSYSSQNNIQFLDGSHNY